MERGWCCVAMDACGRRAKSVIAWPSGAVSAGGSGSCSRVSPCETTPSGEGDPDQESSTQSRPFGGADSCGRWHWGEIGRLQERRTTLACGVVASKYAGLSDRPEACRSLLAPAPTPVRISCPCTYSKYPPNRPRLSSPTGAQHPHVPPRNHSAARGKPCPPPQSGVSTPRPETGPRPAIRPRPTVHLFVAARSNPNPTRPEPRDPTPPRPRDPPKPAHQPNRNQRLS